MIRVGSKTHIHLLKQTFIYLTALIAQNARATVDPRWGAHIFGLTDNYQAHCSIQLWGEQAVAAEAAARGKTEVAEATASKAPTCTWRLSATVLLA